MDTKVTHCSCKGKDESKNIDYGGLDKLSDSTLLEIDAFSNEYILRLAKAALIAGNIPQGDTLAPFISDGIESDNEKAVESWIRSHIEMLVEIAPKNHIEKIIEEIDNRLQEVKTGYITSK